MPRLLNATVIALAASLLLAGCSLADPSGPTDLSGEPAAGKKITGTGYSFVAPGGWGQAEEKATPQGIDTFAADLGDTDGFADNVNVLLAPAGQVTLEQVESQGVDELEGAGATDVSARDRVMVAGSESSHLTAGFSSNGAEYQIEQFYASHEGQTYVVTFSFSPTVSEADRDALWSSVLMTWAWS